MKLPRNEISALSLGSNLGDRLLFLDAAVNILGSFGCAPLLLSCVYETEPVECRPQPPYLNQVITLKGAPVPRDLLALAVAVERMLGRRRRGIHSARSIDVDLVFCGRIVVKSASLPLPHPALARRRSILLPLREIAPDWRHPILGGSVRELARACPDRTRVIPLDRGPLMSSGI